MKLPALLLTAAVGFILATSLRPVAAQVPTSALNDACTGNLNNDGAINTVDLLLFLGAFGQTCEPNISSPGAGVSFGGYNYATVVLGNGQEWMAENLRTAVYANGDPIPNVTDNSTWWGLTTGAWSHYNNNALFENPYGKLYNWYTVADPRNVCPAGWHVPTDAEYSLLTDFLGTPAEMAGGKLKSTGTQYWLAPNGDATNEAGFSALPGGMRLFFGFDWMGLLGYYWSATEFDTSKAWHRSLTYLNGNIVRDYNGGKAQGLSVRCLKN